ncbi:hypothetical protein CONLIGDRAFT_694856 [Coniochaeta ligniaria NRRL 30616]|uniref:Heterokaryon incompatibility domain-containing protein n=1 Tax=Coniochaeta ligniaria NRRL 30616 TaxID=1408157 RepID=A0A1J7I5M1_9PEZI|nr:hypothetical protein CONLIGDRAFT_694856 [Coniochaeta ligniaria NRRL 30616]
MGFLLEDMTPIQQDAVALTRALNVPYLWIDALCIRQGDAADWEKESSQMHKVYAGSYATICALLSMPCEEGFLGREDNPVRTRLPFVIWHDDKDHHGTFELGHSAIYSDNVPVSEMVVCAIESSHWSTRGSTFQEEIMSTRNIYFTRFCVQQIRQDGARD